jgi:hypothetical protein
MKFQFGTLTNKTTMRTISLSTVTLMNENNQKKRSDIKVNEQAKVPRTNGRSKKKKAKIEIITTHCNK